MSVKAGMSDGITQSNRGFFWWLTAILTPIGILGGPVALMNLVAGIVDWNGVLGYVVNWWDVHIGEPFAVVLSVITGWLGWPEVPQWVANYFIFGILYSSSSGRSRRLLVRKSNRSQLILAPLLRVIGWPTIILSRFLRRDDGRYDKVLDSDLTRQQVLLTLAPFVIFVALFIANFWA